MNKELFIGLLHIATIIIVLLLFCSPIDTYGQCDVGDGDYSGTGLYNFHDTLNCWHWVASCSGDPDTGYVSLRMSAGTEHFMVVVYDWSDLSLMGRSDEAEFTATGGYQKVPFYFDTNTITVSSGDTCLLCAWTSSTSALRYIMRKAEVGQDSIILMIETYSATPPEEFVVEAVVQDFYPNIEIHIPAGIINAIHSPDGVGVLHSLSGASVLHEK